MCVCVWVCMSGGGFTTQQTYIVALFVFLMSSQTSQSEMCVVYKNARRASERYAGLCARRAFLLGNFNFVPSLGKIVRVHLACTCTARCLILKCDISLPRMLFVCVQSYFIRCSLDVAASDGISLSLNTFVFTRRITATNIPTTITTDYSKP